MKRTLVTVISLFLFFAASLGAISVAGGYWSLASFEQGESGESTTTSGNSGNSQDNDNSGSQGTTDKNDPDAPAQTEPDKFTPPYFTNTKYAISADSIEGLCTDRSKVSLEKRAQLYSSLAGHFEESVLGDEDTVNESELYNGEKHLVKLIKKGVYPEYTEGTEVVTAYNKVYSSYDASYVTHSTKITQARRKIQPYMGYLLVSRVDETGVQHMSLYSSRAELLVEDMGDIVPCYARDYSNRPIFTDGSSYYIYNDGKLKSVKRDTLRAELYYDYPATEIASYNGKAEVKYFPSYDQYRFFNVTTQKNYIGTRYQYAFNFSSNGLAVVMRVDGEVKIINTSAKSSLGSSAWYIFPGTSNYVENGYKLPDTLGIESIGCTGFDNGWLRLRIQAQSRMNNSYGTIVEDVHKLINAEGEYFDIPEGYTLEGYSNGVLLLSKDGLYGYYSIKGYWIAHPMYDYARPFIQGLAVVGYENGTVGMIDTEGNVVIPFVFTHISDASSGIITAYVEGTGWNVYALCEK